MVINKPHFILGSSCCSGCSVISISSIGSSTISPTVSLASVILGVHYYFEVSQI